jgi:hypothetical protein
MGRRGASGHGKQPEARHWECSDGSTHRYIGKKRNALRADCFVMAEAMTRKAVKFFQ